MQIRFAIDNDWSSYTPFEVIGTEEMSDLFLFDVGVILQNSALPASDVVLKPATLVITPTGAKGRTIQGIVEGFDLITQRQEDDLPTCRFRIVPDLAQLRLNRQSRVLCTTTAASVPSVIGTLLNGSAAPAGITGSYPVLDYLAQYNETDFAFLSRLAEKYGIAYFFDESGVVFTDNTNSYPDLGDLAWHYWSSGAPDTTPDTIQAFRGGYAAVPNEVGLNDYDDRFPTRTARGTIPENLAVSAAVGTGGAGTWADFGEGYEVGDKQPPSASSSSASSAAPPSQDATLADDLALGGTFATARADRFKTERCQLQGRSMVARLSAGYLFTLTGHPFDGTAQNWNQSYLVLSVQHTARMQRPGITFPDDQPQGYFNTFTVMPMPTSGGSPFRPALRTPVPRMPGLMSAIVESSAQTDDQPDIDGEGRYLVRLRYDGAGTAYGEASCRVRMMSPFGGAPTSGPGDGLTFPLYPGTEVAIAHINGDPDRPLIVGVVPNPLQPSLVTSVDPMRNRLGFRSGMGLDAANPPPASGTAADNTVRLWANLAPATMSYDTTRLPHWKPFSPRPQPVVTPHTVPPASPTPYQWLRLGKAADLSAGENGPTQAEGANSGDGFDLATGGVGRVFAGQDLYLIRDGTSATSWAPSPPSGTNRLVGITANHLHAVHDVQVALRAAPTTGAGADLVVQASGAASGGLIALNADSFNSTPDTAWIELNCDVGTINVGAPAGTSGYPNTVNVNGANININGGDVEVTQDNHTSTSHNDSKTTVFGNVVTTTYGSSDNFIMGAYVYGVIGLTLGMYLGSTFNFYTGVFNTTINMGVNTTINLGAEFSLSVQKTIFSSSDLQISAMQTAIKNSRIAISSIRMDLEDTHAEIGEMKATINDLVAYV